MKHIVKWVVIIGLVAGGGWWLSHSRSKPVAASGKGAGASTKPVAALKVSAVMVAPEPFLETVVSTGTLRAEEGVELQAEINGKIVSIPFTEGSRVRKGDLLVKLNDADLKATLARATSRRELAKRREVRIEQLFKDGIANQDEYDAVLNDVAVQEAEIELMQAQIGKTEIRAPFDGVVGLRFVSEGAFVNASSRIATLQRLDHLKVDFSVPERYAGKVGVGSPVSFTVAGGERRFTGMVQATDPRIDASTRTLLVRAICPNPEGRLLPGTFASVEITLSRLEDAILVPSVAVVPGVTDRNVFVASEGKVVRRVVETGTRTETMVQILSGLKVGDVVITSGLQQMRVGLPVEPVFSVVGIDDSGGMAREKGRGSSPVAAAGGGGTSTGGGAADVSAPTLR
jgi:membrane fusion protein (multidrug efflux system)